MRCGMLRACSHQRRCQIDAGGVSKDFFHSLVQRLFDPAYGMFTHDDSTRLNWFNTTSSDQEQEFQLIGIVLGLAIYNSVILDVRFPSVVYRKLCNQAVTVREPNHSTLAK